MSKTQRHRALDWWEEISPNRKVFLCNKYEYSIYLLSDVNIEKMFVGELSTLPPSDKPSTLVVEDEREGKEVKTAEEALESFGELIRTLSRLSNNWRHAFIDEDFKRLEKAKVIFGEINKGNNHPKIVQSDVQWNTGKIEKDKLPTVKTVERGINAEAILQSELDKISKGNTTEIQFCYKAILAAMESYKQQSTPKEGKEVLYRSGVVVLNDLELTPEEFSTVCYHQTGVRLIDEKTFWEHLSGDVPTTDAILQEFCKRLSKLKVVVKNITTSDNKNKYDYPLRYIKYFRDFNISVAFTDQSEFSVIQKVSPPIYAYIKTLPSIEWLEEYKASAQGVENRAIEFVKADLFEELLVEAFVLSELRDVWRKKAGLPLKCEK